MDLVPDCSYYIERPALGIGGLEDWFLEGGIESCMANIK